MRQYVRYPFNCAAKIVVGLMLDLALLAGAESCNTTSRKTNRFGNGVGSCFSALRSDNITLLLSTF